MKMEIDVNISEEKKEYVKNLILYINEVKPFRTKLVNVTEDVNASDEVRLSVSYTISINNI
jgi:hypothetical protein